MLLVTFIECMDSITIILLSVALAMDCFAISIANGIALKRIHLGTILKMAVLFGFFQSFMPLITWLLGECFKEEIEAWDHWIALVILVILGGNMIRDVFSGKKEDEMTQPAVDWKTLILLSIATSIDALATGFVFITETAETFIFALTMIGFASFMFSVAGNVLGVYVGRHLPVNMKLIGGLVLIGIGVKIFLEHTGFLSNIF